MIVEKLKFEMKIMEDVYECYKLMKFDIEELVNKLDKFKKIE